MPFSHIFNFQKTISTRKHWQENNDVQEESATHFPSVVPKRRVLPSYQAGKPTVHRTECATRSPGLFSLLKKELAFRKTVCQLLQCRQSRPFLFAPQPYTKLENRATYVLSVTLPSTSPLSTKRHENTFQLKNLSKSYECLINLV